MKPNVFMSYSRREVGFVDQLTNRLEAEGFHVWLDYRSLIPGSPWKDQIEQGLDESEVILLVVSKESIASKYVELEWRRVIQEEGGFPPFPRPGGGTEASFKRPRRYPSRSRVT